MNFSYGKWTKYHIMKEDETLVGYLPKTNLLSEAAFWDHLNENSTVVIKPSEASQGYGIVLISRLGDNRYEIHSQNSRVISDKKDIEDLLDKEKYFRKVYIIQEKIPLAKVDGCPFDIRVMVERQKESNEWHVTGKLAKVAAKGYFITNVAKEILTLNQAIERSAINEINVDILNTEIESISLLTAYQIGEYYPRSLIIGLDIGITDTGELYIIEANLKPSRAIFNRIKE